MLEPTTVYVPNWHVTAISEHLEACADGRITRLLITVPPGSMKSMLTSVFFQAWLWGPFGSPELRFLTTAFNSTPVERDTIKLRDLLQSDWYQEHWPHVKLTRNGLTLANTMTGVRMGVSFSSLTSQRGDMLIIDDPMSVSIANSDTEREQVVRLFREGAQNRLNNQEKSVIIVIMQRLHEEDIAGVILDLGLPYVHLNLPMEFDPETRCETEIGFVDPREEDGELLDPVRFPMEALEKLKIGMSSDAYAGQYQQRPVTKGGGILKRAWWRLWDADEAIANGVLPGNYPVFDYCIGVVDTAYTEKEENDPSAMTIWGVWTDRYGHTKLMLAYAWAKRLEFRALVEQIAQNAKKYKVDKILVESKASGISVVQELRRMYYNEVWPVQMVDPKGLSKTARAHAVSHLLEQGLVYAPNTVWADKVIDECASFPKGKHDDLTDTVVFCLAHMRLSDMATLPGEQTARREAAEAYIPRSQRAGASPLYPT